MPLWALAVLFLLVPFAELYVIYKIGDAIGYWWVFVILAADSLLGAYLLRSQGRVVWARFNRTLSEGRVPHREVIDGVLVIFGGAFLITPGFISDILGVFLLLPPTRGGRTSHRGRAAWAAGLRWLRRGGRSTTTSRAPRASTTTPPSAGWSGERPGARAVLLRRRPRHPRDGAVGHDHPVRGAQADGPPGGARGRGRGRRLAGGAGGQAVARVRAGVAARRPRRRPRPRRPRARRGRRAARGRARHRVGDRGAAAVGGARRDARHHRPGRRAARARGARPASARRRRARRRGGGRPAGRGRRAPGGGGRPHLDRLRRRRPPAQRRARAVAARRGLPAPRLGPGDRRLVARPGRRSGCTRPSSAGGSRAARASAPTS